MNGKEDRSKALLERLMRDDSKYSYFLYREGDFSFQVAHPQTNVECGQSGDLFPRFWSHIQAHYFSDVGDNELCLLHHFRQRFPVADCQFRSSFVQSLSDTFDAAYLRHVLNSSDPHLKLMLKTLYMQWLISSLSTSTYHSLLHPLKSLVQKLNKCKSFYGILTTENQKNTTMRLEGQLLEQIIQLLEDHFQQSSYPSTNDPLQLLQQQLAEVSARCGKNIDQLLAKVNSQQATLKKIKDKRSNNVQDKLQSLAFEIKHVEQKQKAESMAKIIETIKHGGQYYFKVTFQKAISIQPKLLSQGELQYYNKLREPSMLIFYRTALKSRFAYICQNFAGFRELLYPRSNLERTKDKCMVDMLKKGLPHTMLSEVQNKMNEFNMCHHCKFLYPEHLLTTCKFRSAKQAAPRINHDAAEPQFHGIPLIETFNAQNNRISHRFATRRKNCLTAYTKIDDEYVCARKYCKACIKENYMQDSFRQTGICPFCDGVCQCSRCLRNERIVRLKLLYTLLGGPIEQLNAHSSIALLEIKSKALPVRRRGRPKKNNHVTNVVAKRKFIKHAELPVKVLLKRKRGRPPKKVTESQVKSKI